MCREGGSLVQRPKALSSISCRLTLVAQARSEAGCAERRQRTRHGVERRVDQADEPEPTAVFATGRETPCPDQHSCKQQSRGPVPVPRCDYCYRQQGNAANEVDPRNPRAGLDDGHRIVGITKSQKEERCSQCRGADEGGAVVLLSKRAGGSERALDLSDRGFQNRKG